MNDETGLQMGDFSEETEEPHYYSIRLFAEEEGYEADSESNPEDGTTKDEGNLGTIFYGLRFLLLW